MAQRLNRRHQDLVRAKIKTSNILKVLHDHVHGLRDLTPAQVTSAKILLDKSLSNAPQITELTGLDGGPMVVMWEE